MTQGNGAGALASELTLPSEDSKPAPKSDQIESPEGRGPMVRMEPKPPETPPLFPQTPEELVETIVEQQTEAGMSNHPKAIEGRRYRLRSKMGLTKSRPNGFGAKPRSHKPLWSADQIREKLRKYDRTPFMDLLGGWLECAPTPEALVAFADRWPDRYASSLLSISRIAGFAERREVLAELTGKIQVEHLSDSQLEDKLRQLAYEMDIPLPPVLELRALPEPPADDGSENGS